MEQFFVSLGDAHAHEHEISLLVQLEIYKMSHEIFSRNKFAELHYKNAKVFRVFTTINVLKILISNLHICLKCGTISKYICKLFTKCCGQRRKWSGDAKCFDSWISRIMHNKK